MTTDSRTVTRLLEEMSAGRQEAFDRLLPLVYDELRRRAERYLRRERRDHTLRATALVHEAYLRLVEQRERRWENRAHFFAIAAQAMRRVLVDYARGHNRAKRGGACERVSIEEVEPRVAGQSVDLLGLDEALSRLAKLNPEQSRIVELRFFGGLTIEETAEVLGISAASLGREWRMARAWLYRELSGALTAGQ